jgi:hypothetical protein
VARVNISEAGMAHWLCVTHASGGNKGNYVHWQSSTSVPSYPPPHIPMGTQKIAKFEIITNQLHTYSEIYLICVHNIAPTYFCSHGNVICSRKHYVEIKHMRSTSSVLEKFTSALKETKYGVPQGSVLGPILFLLYINGLPLNISGGRTVLFADDINIQIEADNAETLKKKKKIKESMQQLSRWFYINKLVINTEKTTAISFHAWQNKNNLKPQIVFRDMDIRYGDTKFLGLYLTEDVKWDVHINHKSNILNRSYYVIQLLKNSISINTL